MVSIWLVVSQIGSVLAVGPRCRWPVAEGLGGVSPLFFWVFASAVLEGASPTLKTGNGESRSWVQIPPHPFFNAEKRLGYAVQAVQIAGGCRGLRSASFVRPALVSSGSRGPKGRVGQGCFIRNREGLPWSRLDQDFQGRPRFPGVAIRSAAASRSSNCPLILIRISPSGQSETARASQST